MQLKYVDVVSLFSIYLLLLLYVVDVFLQSYVRILLGVPQIFLSEKGLRCQMKLGNTAVNRSFCAYEVITVAAGLFSKIVAVKE